jgi:hypothetical protein
MSVLSCSHGRVESRAFGLLGLDMRMGPTRLESYVSLTLYLMDSQRLLDATP